MITGPDARLKFKQAVKKAFADVVNNRKGELEVAGREIGSSRQALQQYADGAIPGADVLLAAFIVWEMVIRIEDPDAAPGETRLWECSVTQKQRRVQAARRQPEQLPLFQAIDDLEEQNLELKILRKGPNKIELGLEIAFPKRAL
jgi:hypothetical protein